MISKIVRIKKYRVDQKCRQVRSLEAALYEVRERKEQLQESIASFTRWQAEEERRLFEGLVRRGATVIQIDDFNAEVQQLKLQRHEMVSELEQVEQEELSLIGALNEGACQLKEARQMHEKFQWLLAEADSQSRLQHVRREDREQEDESSDVYCNVSSSLLTLSLGA